MKTAALVACVKSKREKSCAAADLYDSPWFRKARAYAQARSDTWRILSAKHGALPPDEVIEPYDESLHDFTVTGRREWAERVLETLGSFLAPTDEVIILAGRKYREHLEGPLCQRVAEVKVPMEGLGIGKQLQYLNSALD